MRLVLTAAIFGLAAQVAPANAQILSESDQAFVCRAAIAEIMGRPIGIIEAERRGDVFWTTYIRPDDGTRWTNVCRLDGDNIVWASVNDGEIGRWRTDPLDGEVIFVLDDAGVTITEEFSDGSSASDMFVRD